MSFLPIAQRELRAASRRLSTHRLRCGTALLAMGLSLYWPVVAPAIAGAASVANPLFGVQTACAFGVSLLAGVFLTSDCLSEEKREGTLGLLLLTDLRSHDIVLGKFAATALNALCCLLALLPVTAVPLLVGGVSLAEFCRMALALLNGMFFSLAAGLCVSAFVNRYAHAVGTTLALVAVTAAGLPALAGLGSRAGLSAGWLCFTLASPFYPFACAGDANYVPQPTRFWVALFASHLLAWLFLGLASTALTSLAPNGEARALGGRVERRAPSSRLDAKRRPLFRARNRGVDPVLSLTGSGTMLRWLAWTIVAVWAVVVCNGRFWPSQPILAYSGAKPFAFLLKILVAFQACRFFVETRRNGSLEVLLCTPLRNTEILSAQWRALRGIFLWPLIVFLLLQVVTASASPPWPSSSRSLPRGAGNSLEMESGFLGIFFLAAGLLADILAVGWSGMWLALTMKKPILAPALTILLVLVLPSCLYRLDLVVDMLFISWGTTQLQQDFRWVALGPTEPAPVAPLDPPRPGPSTSLGTS